LYQANPSAKTVKPVKNVLKGSSLEKVETRLLAPSNKAKTGVIQQMKPKLLSVVQDLRVYFLISFLTIISLVVVF
jgi:hypothetical protein